MQPRQHQPRRRRHSYSTASSSTAGCPSQERDCLRLFFMLVGVCCLILIVRESTMSSSSSSSSSSSTKDDNDLIDYRVVVEHDNNPSINEENPSLNNKIQMIRYSAHHRKTNKPVSVLEWAHALSQSPYRQTLAQDFNRLIQQLPYDAVYMETKGASSRTASTKPMEVVFLSAPRLQAFAESNPDPRAFGEHFAKCRGSSSSRTSVCHFSNLGGDAHLIAPLPPDMLVVPDHPPVQQQHGNTATTTTAMSQTTLLSNRHYSHLAAFARHAPSSQVTEFWTTVAREYYQRLLSPSSQPTSNDAAAAAAIAGSEPEVWWLNTEGTGVAWLHVRLDRRPKYYHYMPFAHET